MLAEYRKISLILSALLALGCGGNAVDLGHGRHNQGWSDAPDREASTSTPQTIYDSDLPILGFALDGPTLYALVYRDRTYDLISCPLERCRSQRTTLYSPKTDEGKVQVNGGATLVVAGDRGTTLVVAGDRVFWLSGTDLMACPTTGCTEPQRVSSVQGVNGFAADAAALYWLDGNKAVQRLQPNTDVPEPVRGPIAEIRDPDYLVVGGDYLYISDPGADLPNIHRVRKDGTGDAELVVEDEAISGLCAIGDSIYYPSKILLGRCVECAPDDCAKSAVTLANNQRWPMELRVAGDEAFWLTKTPTSDHPSHSSISSCRLPECSSVDIRVADFYASDYQYHPHFAVGPGSLIWLEPRLAAQIGSSLRRIAR
jgi:hypothetical protein